MGIPPAVSDYVETCGGCDDGADAVYSTRFNVALCARCFAAVADVDPVGEWFEAEQIEWFKAEHAKLNGDAAHGTLHRLDVGRMVRELPPPVPWIIEGLAVEGCLTLLTGREGEGKSLLADALAAGVALGEGVAGLDCRQGRALVVDAENGEREIHRRVHTLGLPASGVEVVEAEGFHLGRNLDELATLVREVRPMLLVLDSYRSLWPGGDENDPARVAEALDPLRNLIRSEGAGAILLHHLPKNAQANYRGTTAIGAAVELGFRLSRAQGDPESADRRRLDCFKCRCAPEPPRSWLRLHTERGRVYVDWAEPYKADGETERPQPVRADLAPEMLAAATEPITWPDLARSIGRGPKDGTARRLRDDLLAGGELVEVADGLLRCKGAIGIGTPENGSTRPDSRKVPGCHDRIEGPPDGTRNGRPDAKDGEYAGAQLGLSAYDDGEPLR